VKQRIELSLDDLVEAVGDLLVKRKAISARGTITIWIETKNGNATAVNVDYVPG
jgi:hypothetical protein